MSTIRVPEADVAGWRCEACDQALLPTSVNLEYLGSRFNVELPACPACGMVLIPEALARGKMHEVEQLLEDK
ncbi:MAG: DVU_1557 family redox protein [Desulfovibrio sp.]